MHSKRKRQTSANRVSTCCRWHEVACHSLACCTLGSPFYFSSNFHREETHMRKHMETLRSGMVQHVERQANEKRAHDDLRQVCSVYMRNKMPLRSFAPCVVESSRPPVKGAVCVYLLSFSLSLCHTLTHTLSLFFFLALSLSLLYCFLPSSPTHHGDQERLRHEVKSEADEQAAHDQTAFWTTLKLQGALLLAIIVLCAWQQVALPVNGSMLLCRVHLSPRQGSHSALSYIPGANVALEQSIHFICYLYTLFQVRVRRSLGRTWRRRAGKESSPRCDRSKTSNSEQVERDGARYRRGKTKKRRGN